MKPAHCQKMTAAGRDTEYISQGAGKAVTQEAQVIRVRILFVESFRCRRQQFGRLV